MVSNQLLLLAVRTADSAKTLDKEAITVSTSAGHNGSLVSGKKRVSISRVEDIVQLLDKCEYILHFQLHYRARESILSELTTCFFSG